jgi:hypothetical protein
MSILNCGLMIISIILQSCIIVATMLEELREVQHQLFQFHISIHKNVKLNISATTYSIPQISQGNLFNYELPHPCWLIDQPHRPVNRGPTSQGWGAATSHNCSQSPIWLASCHPHPREDPHRLGWLGPLWPGI